MMTPMRLIPLAGLLSLTAVLLTACPSTTPADTGKTPTPDPTNAITPPLVIPATTTQMFDVRGSSTMPDFIVKDAQLAANRWNVLLTGRAKGETTTLHPIMVYLGQMDQFTFPASTGIYYYRPAGTPGAGLPDIAGIDVSADFIKNYNQNRRQSIDILTHELGHALGLGSMWGSRKLISESCMNDPQPLYLGQQAAARWTAAQPTRGPLRVENDKIFGATCVHWEADQLSHDVMAASATATGQVITDVSRSALADLGWEVTTTTLPQAAPVTAATSGRTIDLSGDVRP